MAASAGFTLLEVIVTASVMVFAIASCLTALQFGMRAVDTARNLTLAGQIMQGEVEILRLQNWSQIAALPASATIDPATTISPGGSSSLDTLLNTVANRFTCTRTVANTSGRTTMKDITLTVTWRGIDYRQHSVSYKFRYAKNGISDYFYTSH